VSPDGQPNLPPGQIDVGVVPLLLSEVPDPIGEVQSFAEVLEAELLLEVVLLHYTPVVAQSGQQVLELRSPEGRRSTLARNALKHGQVVQGIDTTNCFDEAPGIESRLDDAASRPPPEGRAPEGGTQMGTHPRVRDFCLAARIGASIVLASLGLALVSAPAPASPMTHGQVALLTPVQMSGNGSSAVDENPIAADPSGTGFLMSAGNDLNCSSGIGIYNFDGIATWSSSCMPVLTGYSGCGHPGVAYGNGNNLAYVVGDECIGSAAGVAFAESTSNGPPWTGLVAAVSPVGTFTHAGEPSIEVDHNPASPFFNRAYISATQNTLPIGTSTSSISVSFASSPGVWSAPALVDATQSFPYIDQFSDLAVSPDGAVYVTWMKCKAVGPANDCGGTYATIFLSKSTDGGSSWTAPIAITNVPLAPDACGCAFYGSLPNTSEPLTEIPAIDASPVDGTLYVVVDGWTGTWLRVRVKKSTDGGATWSWTAGFPSPPTGYDEFLPWLSVNANGYVGVSWLDRRNDIPNHILYQPFASRSNNGGTTWTNTLLTPAGVFSDPAKDGYGGTYLGDRTGNVWTGLTFHVTWPDTNNSTNVAQATAGGI
jgi:hypothetical protein